MNPVVPDFISSSWEKSWRDRKSAKASVPFSAVPVVPIDAGRTRNKVKPAGPSFFALA